MNNQHADINVGNQTPTNFQPIPKRFMIWDTETNSFCGSQKNRNGIFDIDELADFMECHRSVSRTPMNRFIFCQSTNIFDKDSKEIFEGGVIDYNDNGDALGIVVGVDGQWQLKDKNGNLMFLKGAPHQKLVGHILANPELLEGKE